MGARNDPKFEDIALSEDLLRSVLAKVHDAVLEIGEDMRYSDDEHIARRVLRAAAHAECLAKHLRGLHKFVSSSGGETLCSICGHELSNHYDCTWCLEEGCGCKAGAHHLDDRDDLVGILPLAKEVE